MPSSWFLTYGRVLRQVQMARQLDPLPDDANVTLPDPGPRRPSMLRDTPHAQPANTADAGAPAGHEAALPTPRTA